jgi:hypothetical protein
MVPGGRWSWRVALVALSGALGCAFTDETIRLPAKASVVTGSRRGEGREILLVGALKDTRPETRCGMKKNGYNSDTASVLCETPPAKTIAGLLSAELANAGFVVLRDPRAAGPGTIALSAVLEQAFVEPKLDYFYATFETDISLKLTAWTGSGLLAERRFYVKGQEATYWTSPADMERSFESAARQLVIGVVGAVANLADQFPAEPPAPAPAPEPAVAPPERGAADAGLTATDGGAS